MGFLNVIRGVVFGLVALFSLVILAFSILDEVLEGPTTIANLPLATAVITILLLLITFILELVIRSGVTSLVAIELPRIGILWVLWLASGANFYSVVRLSASLCIELNSLFPDPTFNADCAGGIIVPALSFINFILLFAWFITLLTFSAMNNHWTSPITRTDLTKKKGTAEANAGNGKPSGNQVIYSQLPIPQQQQGYYWVPTQQVQTPGYGVPPQQAPPVMQGPGYWVPGPAPQGQMFQGGYSQQQQPQQFPPQPGFQSPVPQQGHVHQVPQPGLHPGTPINSPVTGGQTPPVPEP